MPKFQTKRKYDKDEVVNVNRKGFQGIGTVENWKYDRQNKEYEYFLRDLTGVVHGWWDEKYLDQLRIHIPSESKEKMEVFYEMLNTTGIGVSYQYSERKEIYALTGIDLEIARAFFNAVLRSEWTNQVIVNDKLYLFHPDGTLREEQSL